jgi:hypothetical protein
MPQVGRLGVLSAVPLEMQLRLELFASERSLLGSGFSVGAEFAEVLGFLRLEKLTVRRRVRRQLH